MERLLQYLDDLDDLYGMVGLIVERLRRCLYALFSYSLVVAGAAAGVWLALRHPPLALATCILTIMAKVAERRNVDLTGVRAELVKDMAADPDRRIGTIRTVLHMPAGLDEKDQTILERAALTCPVHRSLAGSIDLPIEFRYGD